MSGSMIQLSVDDREALGAISRLAEKGRDMTPLMETLGETIRSSVVRNFEAGGRPDRWPKSQRVIKKGGKTLIKSGRLMNSIHARAYPNMVEVGTNVIYAAAHQFGNRKSFFVEVGEHMRRAHSRDVREGGKPRGRLLAAGQAHVNMHRRMQHMNLPKRPFLMIQDKDWPVILGHAKNFLAEANQ
ncbi:MAG: phage virion morphogenesis protein [Nitrospiraceae bacterium]|nr:phage virion morphogenesis protein [Nitrospiraceae bacterium]